MISSQAINMDFQLHNSRYCKNIYEKQYTAHIHIWYFASFTNTGFYCLFNHDNLFLCMNEEKIRFSVTLEK